MANFGDTILKIDTFWRKVTRVLSIIGGAVLIGATLLVVADVSGRFFLNKPIIGGVEATGLMMPYIIFFAMAYAMVLGSHVRVTIVFSKLPRHVQLWVDSLACVVGLFLLSVLMYYSWNLFWKSLLQNEPLMAQVYLPAWAGRFAMPVGLFVFVIHLLIRLIENIGRLTNKIKAEEKAAVVAVEVEEAI